MSDLFINRGALKYLTYLFHSPGAGLLVENTTLPRQPEVSQGQRRRETADWKDREVNFSPGLLQASSASPSNQTSPHDRGSAGPLKPLLPHTHTLTSPRRLVPSGEPARNGGAKRGGAPHSSNGHPG